MTLGHVTVSLADCQRFSGVLKDVQYSKCRYEMYRSLVSSRLIAPERFDSKSKCKVVPVFN